MAVMKKQSVAVNATTGPLDVTSSDKTLAPGRQSSNRAFGLVFAMVFTIVACWPLLRGEAPRYWALVIGVAFLVCALVLPDSLAVLNRWWTRFGVVLGRVVSPLALGIVYYVAVVPVGIMMRLFGKDNLGLRFDRSAASYWVIRDPKAEPDDSMKNQF